MWTTGPTWLDLGNPGGQEAFFLQPYCPPLRTRSLHSMPYSLGYPGTAGRRSDARGVTREPMSRWQCAPSAAERYSLSHPRCRLHKGTIAVLVGYRPGLACRGALVWVRAEAKGRARASVRLVAAL